MNANMVLLTIIAGIPGILAGVVILGVALLVCFFYPGCTDKPKKNSTTQSQITSDSIKKLSKTEVEQRLQKLLETPPPEDRMSGALCYSMAPPPQRAEYVCPACGNKTLYSEEMAKVVAWDIQSARRIMMELKKVSGDSASLDESQFCRNCSPDVKNPKLILQIDYQDSDPRAVTGVTPEDLLLLTEFLSGKLTHDTGMTGEKPLKAYSTRLEEILGCDPK